MGGSTEELQFNLNQTVAGVEPACFVDLEIIETCAFRTYRVALQDAYISETLISCNNETCDEHCRTNYCSDSIDSNYTQYSVNASLPDSHEGCICEATFVNITIECWTESGIIDFNTANITCGAYNFVKEPDVTFNSSAKTSYRRVQLC